MEKNSGGKKKKEEEEKQKTNKQKTPGAVGGGDGGTEYTFYETSILAWWTQHGVFQGMHGHAKDNEWALSIPQAHIVQNILLKPREEIV